MTDANDSKDLVIVALKQRIGELVQNYEYAIATLRADLTSLDQINKQLVQKLNPVPEVKKEFPSVSEILEEKNV